MSIEEITCPLCGVGRLRYVGGYWLCSTCQAFYTTCPHCNGPLLYSGELVSGEEEYVCLRCHQVIHRRLGQPRDLWEL